MTLDEEEPLVGGMDNAGKVVRVGNTVRRPIKVSSEAVHTLLLHLESVGFDGAPRYLGSDERGREVLSFTEGLVPLPPYPAWAMTDDVLTDVARLLRRYHEAVADFSPANVMTWMSDFADPLDGSVVCHNDVSPENVVFRDGRPVALIDFDLAAPGRALWDVAITVRGWAPLSAPQTRHHHPSTHDGVDRLRRFVNAYGVDPEDAEELVNAIFAQRQQMLAHIQGEIAKGVRVWIDNWQGAHGEERARADDAWLEPQRTAMIEAIAGYRSQST